MRIREMLSAVVKRSMLLRLILPIICWLVCLPLLHGTDAVELLRQADTAEAGQNSRQALDLLKRAEELRPNDALILQKIARQYSDLVIDQPGIDDKKQYAQIALEYAKRAVALNPRDPVNILSLAVCHGKLAVYSDTRDKVRYSRLVREEAEQALALDPNYAWAHHVLGRWHCEMASLSAASRFFVKLFYGELPSASIADGLRHLRRATELEPTELNHWLELGFAYFAAGSTELARAQWTQGLSMPSRGVHDGPAKQRASEALAELK